MIHSNTWKRALIVKHLVDEYFEPSNQSKCLCQVWRLVVLKYYPCSIATFYRYITYATAVEGFIGKGGNRITVKRRKPIQNFGNNAVQLSLNL